MRIRTSAARLLVAISLLGGAAACGMTDFPSYIAGVENSQQTIAPGAQSAPLTVQVKDQDGDALSGVVVNYTIRSGAGSLSAPSATTNDDGRASVTFTAGTTTGTTVIDATVATLGAVGFNVIVK
jgi:hypothetical protein